MCQMCNHHYNPWVPYYPRVINFWWKKNSFRISYKKIIFRTIRISKVALIFASQVKFAGIFCHWWIYWSKNAPITTHCQSQVSYSLVNAIFDSSGNCTTHFFLSFNTHTVRERLRLFFTEKVLNDTIKSWCRPIAKNFRSTVKIKRNTWIILV